MNRLLDFDCPKCNTGLEAPVSTKASTALCPSPAIALELWSRGIELFEASYDLILETDDIFRDLVTESRRHFVERKS